MRSALPQDASGFEDDDALSQGKYLVATMRDIKNRNALRAIPLLEIVNNVGLRGRIERGQRFIQKQKLRIGDQGSSQRDSLALSARDVPYIAATEMRDTQCLQHGSRALPSCIRAKMVQTVRDVLFRGHVWKQREILENVAHVPVGHRQIHARGGIENRSIADRDSSIIRSGESGHAIEKSRLPGSRGPEQDREASGSLEGDIHSEVLLCGKAFLDTASQSRLSSRIYSADAVVDRRVRIHRVYCTELRTEALRWKPYTIISRTKQRISNASAV